MNQYSRLAVIFIVVLLSGCASLQSVSISTLESANGRAIEGMAEDFLFLGLTGNNKIATEAAGDLYSKCPNGTVSGILTSYEKRVYVFFVKRTVRLRGFCNENG